VYRTTASIATPTLNVFVRTIGVSIVPSSVTCVDPASLPNAFPMNTAPATFSWKRFPPCGRTARYTRPHVIAFDDGGVTNPDTLNVRDPI
jgi:hypothetical protein